MTMNSEIDLKRKLIEATDAVRKKYNSIKTNHVGDKLALEKVYEPITTPLKQMTSILSSPSVQPSQNQPDILFRKKKRKYSSSDSTNDNHTENVQPTHSHSLAAAAAAANQEMHSDDDDIGSQTIKKLTSSSTPPIIALTPPTSEVSQKPEHIESSGSKRKMQYVAKAYIEGLKSGDSIYDSIYGIRVDSETGKLLMGNAEVRFPGRNIAIWLNDRRLGTYRGSSHLYDLIFLRLPSAALNETVSKTELEAYSDILHKTNVIYKNYDKKLGLKINKSRKYLEIIKPLIQSRAKSISTPATRTRSQYTGTGVRRIKPKLPTVKILNVNGNNERRRTVNYVYWNKPRELVDRLRLLWSSKMAGHTGHDNEIISIIEELREEGIIY